MRGAFVCSLIASFITSLAMLVLFLRRVAPETLTEILDRPGWQLVGGALVVVLLQTVLVFVSMVIADYCVRGYSYLLQVAVSILVAVPGASVLQLSWANDAARTEAMRDPFTFMVGAAMPAVAATILASLLYFERERKRIIA